MRNRKGGYSVLEMVLSIAILGALGICSFSGQQLVIRQKRSLESDLQAEERTAELYQQILRVGRASGTPDNPSAAQPQPIPSEKKCVTPNLRVLLCWLKHPVFGPTFMKFEYLPNEQVVTLSHWTGKLGPNGERIYEETTRYPGIQNALFCNDTAMVNNQCPIAPLLMNERHAEILRRNPARADRFFRFLLVGSRTMKSVQYSGTFYVRNPTGLFSLDGKSLQYSY